MNENVYEYELNSNKRPKLRVHHGFKIHFKFTIWLYRLSVFGHSNKRSISMLDLIFDRVL